MSDQLDVDLLVIGAGMAGMTAAGHAARSGCTVVVVERAPQIGGSAALSEGYVWTAPSLDVLLDEDPGADPALGRILVESLEESFEWVRSLGVPMGEPLTGVLGFGVGRQIDVHAFLRACCAAVEANGGWIVTGAEPRELLVENGRVVGARIDQEGQEVTVRAPWAMIATGGFQANPELVRRYVRPTWDPVQLRSNHYSTGGGIALAQAAGAALTEPMNAFYGHLIPNPLSRPLTHTDYTALAQYHSEHGLLLDHAGRRFADESRGDHVNTMAVAAQDGERALLVCDEWIRQEQVLKAFIPGMDQGLDKFELAADAGARRAKADSVETLADAVGDWGYNRDGVVRTIEEFNRLVDASPGKLLVPRLRHRRPLDSPPYVALEVQPAITFTYGGLRTDEHARVLDEYSQPLDGLLAAGADAGGAYVAGYAGGLVRGLVFGIRAARTVAAARAAVSVSRSAST